MQGMSSVLRGLQEAGYGKRSGNGAGMLEATQKSLGFVLKALRAVKHFR